VTGCPRPTPSSLPEPRPASRNGAVRGWPVCSSSLVRMICVSRWASREGRSFTLRQTEDRFYPEWRQRNPAVSSWFGGCPQCDFRVLAPLVFRMPNSERPAPWRIWAAVWMAWFRVRFPRLERRWRTLPPEETSMGAVPLHAAYLPAVSNRPIGGE